MRARRLSWSPSWYSLCSREGDLNQIPARRYVIDFYPHSEQASRVLAPKAFQHVLNYVKPGRDVIRDRSSRVRWWRFGRDKPELRAGIATLQRYIATSEVSKHRTFSFVASGCRPDHSLIVIASDQGFILGVLSSRIHEVWSLSTGGRLGKGDRSQIWAEQSASTHSRFLWLMKTGVTSSRNSRNHWTGIARLNRRRIRISR